MPYIPIIPIIIVVLLILLFAFVPMRLWITALASGSHVGIGTLIGMRLRKVPPAKIVLPLIQARKAGLQLNTNQLESHYMAGGHVDAVVNALIASSRAGMNIPFEMAAAIDLAGRDVLEAVRMSVNPKVIETPNISAVAKDGIELLVKARVTVRTNINQLVGGAGEATVIARVGEGIVTTVVQQIRTRACLRILILSLRLYCRRVLILEQHSRFFLLILRMLISEEI